MGHRREMSLGSKKDTVEDGAMSNDEDANF